MGRDPTELDEKEVARAAVESVAENTVDAVVAPVLWAGVLGAPGALAFRAINTMDALVGHRSPRYAEYGWASARLDDAAAWMPARAVAVIVAAVRPRQAADVVRIVRRCGSASDVRCATVRARTIAPRGTLGRTFAPIAHRHRRTSLNGRSRVPRLVMRALTAISPFIGTAGVLSARSLYSILP